MSKIGLHCLFDQCCKIFLRVFWCCFTHGNTAWELLYRENAVSPFIELQILLLVRLRILHYYNVAFLRLPWLKRRGFLPTCQRFSSSSTEAELLLAARKTLRQTRSGSGNAKALGESFPRFSTLLHLLYCCPQARLRTFPIRL